MKKSYIIFLAFLMTLFLLGCSLVNQEYAAKQLVVQYKTSLYNIENYNKAYPDSSSDPEGFFKSLENYKKYFTEEGYNQFIFKKTAIIPLEACAKGKHTLKVTNIRFDKVSEEKNKLILDYTVSLKAIYTSGEKTTEEKSQAILVKENNEWKICNDWFYINDLFQEDLNSLT
ncbi:hypothetical protein Desor_1582 [Desulfosporosinus orientis DSM 765]|uniref:DUF4829 domain-containing protein n=1 Tax=Desulfosporosinus orientis (strain ATCC 19365 / DSM 765 / NCIMB 8382 / VKM B-1628 / Singapore I) TaxID=768706 RepID=G7WD34_DESOD|nr:hypothetical protein [Desulfosporosinus orientis]AET67229.1 hypothetical protein Desor_1582 [Desulfosporosinus orientis DSM 765]